MRIIEGQRTDLVTPFPENQLRRLFNWMHSFKTSVFADGSPQTPEEFIPYMKFVLERSVTYGVIDKHNELGLNHEAPMVGYVAFDPTPINAYAHVASTRRCFGTGLIDEAAKLAVTDMFALLPSLLRISATIIPWNRPARALAERIGMEYEGRMRHMVLQKGKPIDIVHYGMTRSKWGELQVVDEVETDSDTSVPTPPELVSEESA